MQVQAWIKGNLTGGVTAANILRVRSDSAILADLGQTGTANSRGVMATGTIAGNIVLAAGNITEVDSLQGSISANIVASAGTVFNVLAPNGSISGNISSARGQINLITAKNITGAISANGQGQAIGQSYAIGTIIATEDIGTSANPITITTAAGPASAPSANPADLDHLGYYNGGINTIQARNIHANISTPLLPFPTVQYNSSNARGDIRQIVTTGSAPNGWIKGTIDTFTLGDSTSPPARALDVRELQGMINLRGTIKNPARVRGDLASTGTIVLTSQDLNPNGDITIAGALHGRIDISGSSFGDLRINPGSISSTGVIMVDTDLGPGPANAPTALTVGGSMGGTIDIMGNVLGNVTLTGPVSGTVKVGGNVGAANLQNAARMKFLGSFGPSARLEIAGSVYYKPANPPSDPGGDTILFWDDSTTSPIQTPPMQGLVRIANSLLGRIITTRPGLGGMPGQVVIDANNTGSAAFGANARVRVGQAGETGWQNIAAANYASPLSGAIGGGAVGVGQYELHEEDCIPPYDPTPDAVLLTSSFLASPPSGAPAGIVRVRSYGPMKVHADYTPATAVRVEVQNPLDCEEWYPAAQFFTITLFPSGNKRVIELSRVTGSVPYAAVYRVVPEGLVCEEIAGEPPVDWPTDYYGAGTVMPEGAYVFRIGPDCGGPTNDPVLGSPPNGIVDGVDIVGNAAASPPIPPCSACDQNSNFILDWCEMTPATICACDWNLSGVVSVQDLFDFLACYFAGDGDINNSGSTTVQDIFDFLNCFFVKPPPCL